MRNWIFGGGKVVSVVVAQIVSFAAHGAPAKISPQLASGLAWVSPVQHHKAPLGETNWVTRFEFRNATAGLVIITAVQASCGCTQPTLRSLPWQLDAGETGALSVTVDFKGKEGDLTKTVSIWTDRGTDMLVLSLSVPVDEAARRARDANRAIAAADAQAVFRGDCARCHAAPAKGLGGADLYVAVCSICHDSPHRAAMVPILGMPGLSRDPQFWQAVIAHGRSGSLMPAFAREHGGPLDPRQIESLVAYLSRAFPDGAPPPQ